MWSVMEVNGVCIVYRFISVVFVLVSYVDQYYENQRSVKGRWQLKQLGFGPLEGDEVIFRNIITFSVSVLTFVDVWLRYVVLLQ